MKKENILIDAKSAGLTVIEKMDFDDIDSVQDTLYYVFHQNDDNLDPRFLALWTMFLVSVGWTEDEYFNELKNRRENYTCDDCKTKQEQEKLNAKKESN
jgi:hypothetical protein